MTTRKSRTRSTAQDSAAHGRHHPSHPSHPSQAHGTRAPSTALRRASSTVGRGKRGREALSRSRVCLSHHCATLDSSAALLTASRPPWGSTGPVSFPWAPISRCGQSGNGPGDQRLQHARRVKHTRSRPMCLAPGQFINVGSPPGSSSAFIAVMDPFSTLYRHWS